MKTKNINKAIVWLMASTMSLFSMSCNDDIDNSYSRNQSVIELSPSGDYIKLDESNPDATALTLDWTTAYNYGDDYITTYKYEMRVSGSTADEIMEYEDDGHFSRTYSNKQLQDLLIEHFGQLTSTISEVQFTVTASFEGPRLMIPDIATAKVKIKTYGPKQFSADELFMGGTAVGDEDVQLEANNDGTIYSYTGKLNAGKINFPVHFGDEENAIGPSEADAAITLAEMPAVITDRTEANSWIIPEEDTYRVTVNMTNQTVKIVAAGAVVEADQIFLAGSAVGSEQIEMGQTLENDNLYAWRGELSAGNLYIPLTYEGEQAMSIVPLQATSHDVNDGKSSSFAQVATNMATTSRYWTIPSAGTYRIVLNKEEKTITIYSAETDLKSKSVSWNNTTLGINPYTTVIEKLYMYGTFNAYDHDPGVFTGYQDKYNLHQSVADPCVFVYKGEELPRKSGNDGMKVIQATVNFKVDNMNNNVYAFGSTASAKRGSYNGYTTAVLGKEEKIVAGQSDNRYAFFIIPEGCNFVVVNIDKNTVTFDKR